MYSGLSKSFHTLVLLFYYADKQDKSRGVLSVWGTYNNQYGINTTLMLCRNVTFITVWSVDNHKAVISF